MEKRIKVLVSGIGKRNVLIRLLREECIKRGLELIGGDAAEVVPADIEFSSRFHLPYAYDVSFMDNVAALLNRENTVAHLTLIDPEITMLGKIEKEKKCDSLLLNPCLETSRICEDKYLFYLHLCNHNIPSQSTSLTPFEDYPFICKDRKGSASSGFKVFQNLKEYLQWNYSRIDGDYIFQPFCHGIHYCIDAYCSIYSGNLIDFCAKKVLMKSKGESFLLESVDGRPFEPLLNNICSALNLRGIINLDVYEIDGKMIVMEINCRIGGNYPASHSFGCNFIGLMLDEIVSYRPASTKYSHYKIGKRVAKYFHFSDPIGD